MRDISKLILKEYQIRKTKKQKDEFIHLLMNELKDEQIKVEQSGMFKSRNIIVGDLEKAKYVLSAHYDTAPVLPFPNFLTPKNLFVYLLFNVALIFGFVVCSSIISYIIFALTQSGLLVEILRMALLWFFILWMFFGKANKHTANDNTSGVITLLELMECKEIREQVCFVFFDHEELGLLGSNAFNKKHKNIMKDKLLINFDCVSDGDYVMLITSKSAGCYKEKLNKSFYDENKTVIVTKSSNTIYPSDQSVFKNHIGVAAFNKNNLCGYYIDKIHTSKDVVFDERNIKMIVEGICRFIN